MSIDAKLVFANDDRPGLQWRAVLAMIMSQRCSGLEGAFPLTDWRRFLLSSKETPNLNCDTDEKSNHEPDHYKARKERDGAAHDGAPISLGLHLPPADLITSVSRCDE